MSTYLRRANPETHAAISTHHLEDARLSWKAAGLLTYMLTRSDGWELRRGDFINRHKDGKRSVQTALRELREHGYLRAVPRPAGGKDYVVSEMPLSDEQWAKALSGPERPEIGSSGPIPKDRKSVPLTTSEEKTPYSPPLGDAEADQQGELLPPDSQPQKRKRACQLPNGWSPKRVHRERCSRDSLDVEGQADHFRAHYQANGKTYRDWDAAFTTWLMNSTTWRDERLEREQRAKGGRVSNDDAYRMSMGF